ncbi:MAG: preprotein translocase subunit SecG [Geminicoccaceae bacterium]|nr:preprotein translocase subunit SecG [Geminicoccaceae bacterium]
MSTVLLVIHLIIALALVGVILIQRSEGGALGGLGGTTMGGMMSGRGTANLLTRTTAILATCFIVTSLALAIVASNSGGPSSILENAGTATQEAPAATSEPAQPEKPAAPIADK